MKNLKTLITLAIILLISFSCKPETKKEVKKQNSQAGVQELEKKCNDKPKPRSNREMNDSIRLNINLDDQCGFQLVHMEKCDIKDYAIIGRFKSDKKDNGSKNLKSIELYAYNLSNHIDEMSKKYKVIEIKKGKIDDDMITIEVSLSSHLDSVEKPKKNFTDGIKLSKNKVLDFSVTIVGEKECNPILFHGRICKASVVFE